MKLRNLRIQTFQAATIEELQTAVNEWLSPPDADVATRTEEQFVDISFGCAEFLNAESGGEPFYCYITYMEA